jgi:hypothetical protein
MARRRTLSIHIPEEPSAEVRGRVALAQFALAVSGGGTSDFCLQDFSQTS